MLHADRLDNLLPTIVDWRRALHQQPELGYEVHATARLVANRLREFGVDDVVEGVGQTGVVGVIRGRSDSRGGVIGLRADMDALPIHEQTGADWSSTIEGRMHACGHDGHTAMLLGAARALADTRDFDGHVVVIFQPAEEAGAGGKAMVEDGLMERFNIQKVFGMHNMPGIPIGQFAIRPGPLMACADEFAIELTGQGGHAAMPDGCVDTIVAASHLVLALQTIVSRNITPVEPGVVSVTSISGAEGAFNVLPQTATLRGTVRAFDESTRLLIKRRLIEISQQTAQVFGAEAVVNYRDGYPATVNHGEETELAAEVAAAVVGENNVETSVAPTMGAEDFSYMLQERPGAFIFMGNGDSASLHHPQYDFNDDAIVYGCRYWLTLVDRTLPLESPDRS